MVFKLPEALAPCVTSEGFNCAADLCCGSCELTDFKQEARLPNGGVGSVESSPGEEPRVYMVRLVLWLKLTDIHGTFAMTTRPVTSAGPAGSND